MSRAPDRKPRLLLIGPLPRPDSPLGGTQVSFGELLERLRASDAFEIVLCDTSRPSAQLNSNVRWLGDARVLLRTLASMLRHAASCDGALFNASTGAVMLGGPPIALLCRLFDVPLAVRVFGGNLDLRLADAHAIERAVCERTVLAARLLLLQTRALCAQFDGRHNTRWLPTTRDLPRPRGARSSVCRRFLFLSQLRPQKGYLEAIAALARTPGDCTLTIGGPLMPACDPSVFAGHDRVRYIGAVDPRDVPRTLAEHDALLFPSYHVGEGMPGVVIEAMQSGLPVIASRWRSHGELVEHERSGLLVEPRSIDDLALAMERLSNDSELFARLQLGASERGEAFRANAWHGELERWLLELCGRPQPSESPGDRELAIAESAR